MISPLVDCGCPSLWWCGCALDVVWWRVRAEEGEQEEVTTTAHCCQGEAAVTLQLVVDPCFAFRRAPLQTSNGRQTLSG